MRCLLYVLVFEQLCDEFLCDLEFSCRVQPSNDIISLSGRHILLNFPALFDLGKVKHSHSVPFCLCDINIAYGGRTELINHMKYCIKWYKYTVLKNTCNNINFAHGPENNIKQTQQTSNSISIINTSQCLSKHFISFFFDLIT